MFSLLALSTLFRIMCSTTRSTTICHEVCTTLAFCKACAPFEKVARNYKRKFVAKSFVNTVFTIFLANSYQPSLKHQVFQTFRICGAGSFQSTLSKMVFQGLLLWLFREQPVLNGRDKSGTTAGINSACLPFSRHTQLYALFPQSTCRLYHQCKSEGKVLILFSTI